MMKKACLCVTTAELAGVTNAHTSARHLLGQRTGGWLSTLRDVKDKVQSATPAIPKLLPSAMVELTVMNRGSKQNAVNNAIPVTSCEASITKDEDKETPKENNYCLFDAQPVDGDLSQMSSSEYTRHDVFDRETVTESAELSNEFSSKLHVGDLAVSSHSCDQSGVATVEFEANRNNVFSEQGSQLPAENSVDVSHAVGSAQLLPCDNGQNLPSTEHEAQHCTEMPPEPVTVSRPLEIRTFSADVTDFPQIVFQSSRKKRKSVKPGICI